MAFAQAPPKERSLKEEYIADPAFNRRCKKLLVKRTEKMDHKNRLNSLKLKNEYLQKQTAKGKVTLKDKLKKNHFKISQELRMTKLKIDNLEEKIIRKGCSGLIL